MVLLCIEIGVVFIFRLEVFRRVSAFNWILNVYRILCRFSAPVGFNISELLHEFEFELKKKYGYFIIKY